jgi:hypothetical protein
MTGKCTETRNECECLALPFLISLSEKKVLTERTPSGAADKMTVAGPSFSSSSKCIKDGSKPLGATDGWWVTVFKYVNFK